MVGNNRRGILNRALSIVLMICIISIIPVIYPATTAKAVGSDIYVDSYGATPNDSNDDGPAIRAAIQAAKAAGAGSRVLFSQGKYVVSPPPKSWEFNTAGNLEGWIMQNNVSNGTVSGGDLILTINGTDPYIISQDNLTIDSGVVNYIKIRMKNNTSGTAAQFYWLTDTDSVWDANKRFDFTVTANDSGYTEYTIDLRAHSYWKGVIRQIRIDPEQGAGTGTVNIDYVRANVLPEKNWGFNTDGDFENWGMTNQVTGAVSGGNLSLTVSGIDPYIISPDNLSLPTSYRFVKIRMKNNTSSTLGQLYWTTETDTVWDANKRIEFTVKANDSGYTEYMIDTSSNIFWTGKIKQLRLDPENGYNTGTIDIDYITAAQTPMVNSNYNFFSVGLNGISFVGNNTEINFTDSFSGGFIIAGSSTNVTFQGLTIDYATPPFVQGSITAVNSSAGTFDYMPESGYPLLDDPRMDDILTQWGALREPSNPNLMKKTANDAVYIKSWAKLDATTYRITVADSSKSLVGAAGQLEIGDKLVINNRGHGNHIFTFLESSNMTVQDVTIYASPGASVIGGNTDGITVNNLQVLRRPGSGRYISTNADGVHVQASRIGAVVTNSVFEGLLDDAMNFYSRPGMIIEVLSDTKMKIIGRAPLVGDDVQVFDPVKGRIKGTAKVTLIEAISGYAINNRSVVTVDTPIANMVAGTTYKTADSLFNLSTYGSGFRVENNVFRDSRRYGVFVKASNGVITGNTFSELGGSAVNVENEPDWPEGPFAQNVQITNNTINNVVYRYQGNPQYAGAIRIRGSKVGAQLSDELGQQNIVISGNSISHPPRNAIYVGGANGVQITGLNTITADASDYVYDGNITGVKVENAANVTIDGLSITDPRPALNAGIEKRTFADVTATNLNFTLAAGVPNVNSLAPEAPTGLIATPSASTKASLDWVDTQGASSYNVYRGATSGFTPSWNNKIASGIIASAFTDNGLTSGTTYYYKVTAVNASNFESAPSAQSSATPVGPYDWHFNTNADFEGWILQNQASGTVSGGALNLTASGIDPYIHSEDNLGIDASVYKIVKIRMKNNTPSTLSQLYWITDADTTWNSTKRLNFTTSANDTQYVEYVLDLSADPNWVGTIKRLRIDPENGYDTGTVNIDYVLVAVKPITWDFNTDGNMEGWTMGSQVTGAVSGGSLNLTVSGIDPYIYSADALGLNSSNYKTVKIRLKNNTSSTLAQLFWITNTDTTWNSNKRINFTTSANDSGYTEYLLDLSSNAYWTGTIKQLRLDPENGISSGTINVDYIRLDQ